MSEATVDELRSRVETHPYKEPHGQYLESFLGLPGAARSLFVDVELSDGRRGTGEATLLPSWSGEWPVAAQMLLNDVLRSAIAGLPAERAMARAREALAANGYLLWAVESALADALNGLPDHGAVSLRGLVGPFDPETSATLAATQEADGFKRIKVKLSGLLAEDDERLRAVREAVPAASLIVDANESIVLDALQSYCVLFRETQVVGVEQPCSRAVVREQGLPAADGWLWIADESVWGYEDALAHRSGPWHAWTLHPGKSRGEGELARMAEVATQHGIAVLVGSNLHFGPGVPALWRVASSLPTTPESDLLGHDIPAPVVYEGWRHPAVEVLDGVLRRARCESYAGVAV